jgi:hypothetical protein
MYKMITIRANDFDITNIEREINLKVGGVKELTTPAVLEELANAVFVVGAKAFKKAMDLEAKANPKKYHHIYEWKQAGMPMGRLYFLYNKSSTGGKLVVNPGFVKSKNKVPVDPRLLESGRTGKSVASKHVFKDKASVMESGKPIIYRASKNLPIPDGDKIRFIAAGTVIRNYYPGGKQVKGSFEKFFNSWFDTKLNSVLERSGIIEAIDNETVKVLNKKGAGSREVKQAIINLLRQYSNDQSVI